MASRTRPSSRRSSPTPNDQPGNGGGASGGGDGNDGNAGSGGGRSARPKRKLPSGWGSSGGNSGGGGGAGGVIAALGRPLVPYGEDSEVEVEVDGADDSRDKE